MRIVIEIPKDIYECAKEDLMRAPLIIVRAIAKGIPLPEHHGRLGDIDKILGLFNIVCNADCRYSDQERDVMCDACLMGTAIEIVEDAEIIPATEEGAE